MITLAVGVFGVFAALASSASEPWVKPLERSAVVFDRPNGGPCVRSLKWGGKVFQRQFTTGRPAYVMPVGAGNLSAMVSFGEDRWELHLSQADYLVFTNGTTSRVRDGRGLELRSPGHVTVAFDGLTTNAITRFEQKMDMLRGRVTLKIETARGAISAEVFGDRKTGALVVLADDTRTGVAAPAVTQQMKPLRPPAEVRTEGGRIKVAIGITAEATKSALAADTVAQRAATERWWRDYWARGWIDLTGDKRAERLERLWYSNLYVWGSVGYGPMPPKFNGGPGIVFDDMRCWGRNVWWQNTREMVWPMAGANRPELAKSYLDFYGDCHANFACNGKTNEPPKTGVLAMDETVNLFRSPIFTDNLCPVRPPTAPYAELTDEERRAFREERLKRRGGNTSHVHSSGTELLMQMVDYVRYTGDRTMLGHVATYLRSQTELYLKLLEKGPDGKWHVYCSNVNESWVKVDDGIVDLASARWLMTMTAAHGKEFGFPENFVAAAKARLGRIADYPTGPVYENFHSKTGLNFRASGPTVYHPCVLTNGMRKANFENNELYLVHPYMMAGVDEEGPRRQLAIDTYLNGINVDGGAGWTPVAVTVARMRLPQAATIVYNHSKSCNWPFGGANSPGSTLHDKSPYNDTCYMDTTGVMQTGVQELLLQSHAEEPNPSFYAGGPVRLAPCVPEAWSGAFKLRARGGFVIEASFEKGKVVRAKVTSELGNDFTWIDPATGARKTRKTKPGETFELLTALPASAGWTVARFRNPVFVGLADVTNAPAGVSYAQNRIKWPKGFNFAFSFVARGWIEVAASDDYAFRVVRGKRDGACYRILVDGRFVNEQPDGVVHLEPGQPLVEVYGKKAFPRACEDVDFRLEWKTRGGDWQTVEPKPVPIDPAAAGWNFDRTFRYEEGKVLYHRHRTYSFDIPEDGIYEFSAVSFPAPEIEKYFLDGRQVLGWTRRGSDLAHPMYSLVGEPRDPEDKTSRRADFFGRLRTVRALTKGRHTLDVMYQFDRWGYDRDADRRNMTNGVWRFGFSRLRGGNPASDTFFYPDPPDDAMVFELGREKLHVHAQSAVKGFSGAYTAEVRTLRETNVVWRQSFAVTDRPGGIDIPCTREGGFDYVIRDAAGRVVDGPWAFAVAGGEVPAARTVRPGVVVDRVACTEGKGGAHEFRDNGTSEIVRTSAGAYRLLGPARMHETYYAYDPKTRTYSPAPTGMTAAVAQKMRYDRRPRCDWFAYTLWVKHPGRTHVVRCRVPNDAKRYVTVQAHDRKTGQYNGWNVMAGVGEASGDWSTLAFLAWPNAEALDVLVLHSGNPGAFSRRGAVGEIELIEYPDGLPPLEPPAGGWQPERRFGWQGEQGDLWAFERTMPSLWPGKGVFRQGDDTHSYLNWQDFCDVFERVGEIAAFRGESDVGMPVCTYGRMFAAGEVGRLFAPGGDIYMQARGHGAVEDYLDRDVFKLALLKARKYGVKLVFDFFSMGALHGDAWAEYHGLANQTNGFLLSVKATGEPYLGYHTKSQLMNPVHPLARRHFVRFYEALAERYGRFGSLGAVRQRHWLNLPPCFEPTWQNDETGFDDYTVGRFAAESGLADLAPVGTNEVAFAARKDLIRSKYAEKWQDWRTRAVETLYEEMLAAMRKHAPDIRIDNAPMRGTRLITGPHVEVNGFDANCFAAFNVRPGEGANPTNLHETLKCSYPHGSCIDGGFEAAPYHLKKAAFDLASNNLSRVIAGASWVLPPVDEPLRAFVRGYRAIPVLDYRPLPVGCADEDVAAVWYAKDAAGDLVVYAVNTTDVAREIAVSFADGFESGFDLVDGTRIGRGTSVTFRLPAYTPGVWRVKGASAPTSVALPSSEGDWARARRPYERLRTLAKRVGPDVREPGWLHFRVPKGASPVPPPPDRTLEELLAPMRKLEAEGRARDLRRAMDDFNRDHLWWYEAYGWNEDFHVLRTTPFAPWPAALVLGGRTKWRVPEITTPPGFRAVSMPEYGRHEFAALPRGSVMHIQVNPHQDAPHYVLLEGLFSRTLGTYVLKCGGRTVWTFPGGTTDRPRLERRCAPLPVPHEEAVRHGLDVEVVGADAILMTINELKRMKR